MYENRKFWVGLGVGGILVLLFQYSLLFHVHKPLGLLHGDAYLVNFILKHWMEAFTTGQWRNFTMLPMFHGFTGSLFYTDHHFVQALMALPFYIFTSDIITTSNLLVVTTVLLSFASMYVFSWYMTKHAAASIFSGVIFVLNPFVFARYPDQLILFSLQWIPMIFLSFERKRTGWFFFFLVLQLLTSLYYSVFLTVIVPIYAGVRFLQERRKPLIWTRSGVFGFVVFVMITMLSATMYYRVFSKEPIKRSMDVVALYAARPTDWLFTSEMNMLYGRFAPREGRIYSEHSLFPGVIAIALLPLSFVLLRKRSERKYWVVGIILIIVSVVLSFGPMTFFYRLLYTINPLFHFIRTSARFGVFAYFFLAWICGMTLARILSRFSPKKGMIIGGFVILLILGEYWNKPLDFLIVGASTRELYATFEQRKDIQVILEYPIGNMISYAFPQARAEDLDAQYLLYGALFHNKTLFNGYSGFFPAEYYRRANMLSVNFPSEDKLIQVKQWGVDAIILHRDEFLDASRYDVVRNGLITRQVKLVSEMDGLALFDLTTWTGAR